MTVIRKLLPTELSLYRAHLLRLPREDRYARFAGTVSDATIERHCAALDWRYARLLGVFDHGVLRAVAELRADPTFWPENAELALSVERPLQNHGLGRELVRRALTVARNRGIRHVHMLCLSENRRMLALARTFGARVEVDHGEATTDIALPWPNQVTFLVEAMEEGAGVVGAVLDRWQATSDRLLPLAA